jgi:hypothetical protein
MDLTATTAMATAADGTETTSAAVPTGCAGCAGVQRAVAERTDAEAGGGEVNQSAAAFKVPANRLMAIRR